MAIYKIIKQLTPPIAAYIAGLINRKGFVLYLLLHDQKGELKTLVVLS